jgi:hypothetical protein
VRRQAYRGGRVLVVAADTELSAELLSEPRDDLGELRLDGEVVGAFASRISSSPGVAHELAEGIHDLRTRCSAS